VAKVIVYEFDNSTWRLTVMAYIYQADVWCDACGEKIRKELTAQGDAPEDVEDESTYDSDNFPKRYDAENEESDGPENCADGKCADVGKGRDAREYGTFLENQLTVQGYENLQNMLNKHGKTLPDHAREWAKFYGFEYSENEYASAHEWLASKNPDMYLVALMDKIDGDTIQDTFQDEMEEDGFFREAGWYSNEYASE